MLSVKTMDMLSPRRKIPEVTFVLGKWFAEVFPEVDLQLLVEELLAELE